MGKREQRSLHRRFYRIIEPLLKRQYRPEPRGTIGRRRSSNRAGKRLVIERESQFSA